MNNLYSLQHLGYVIPPQADAGWLGEAGPGPSYMDEGSGGPENDFTNRNTTFMTWNLLHLAHLLKDAGGMSEDIAWLQQRHGWPGLKSVIAVESTREIGDKTEHETRLYISSLDLAAAQLGPIIRSHWAIENSLHWVMDMVFRDDECRLRTDHAPANFTTIKHMAQNLIRRDPGKDSLRVGFESHAARANLRTRSMTEAA